MIDKESIKSGMIEAQTEFGVKKFWKRIQAMCEAILDFRSWDKSDKQVLIVHSFGNLSF